MKREIRVLGLDHCNRRDIIGVVTRGGFYLDGVFTLAKQTKSSTLATKLTQTKYFPELRAIIIHDSAPTLDASIIERTTSLPVITISSNPRSINRGYRSMNVSGHHVRVKTGIDRKLLLDILSLTTTQGRLPEPVRIAHLLGKLSLGQRSIAEDKL
jgi:endonuclease V-like protein UPF0215 family